MSASIEQIKQGSIFKLQAMMPFDPETGTPYINAIGNNETEAIVNLDAIGVPEAIQSRIVLMKVTVTPSLE